MKPMLAHRFADHQSSVTYPVYVQPKLDGVRALCNPTSRVFQSRDEVLYKPGVLEHFTEELKAVALELNMTFPEVIFDGELYRHGYSLQQINSAVGVNRIAPSDKTPQIQYHIFDIILPDAPTLPFKLRAEILSRLSELIDLRRFTTLQVVPTILCSQADAEQAYSFYRQQGYEGIMYRDPTAPYGFAERCSNKENRWKCLLKRKDWLDEFFPTCGFKFGEGKYSELLGSVTCLLPSGNTFEVGTGISDYERFRWLTELPTRVKVKFERYSDHGIPLKPTILSHD